MSAPLSYTEQLPPYDLAPWVACFWQIAGGIADGTCVRHRVLPDGCTDILFDLDGCRRAGGIPADVVGPLVAARCKKGDN
jgi:hypothetical protein